MKMQILLIFLLTLFSILKVLPLEASIFKDDFAFFWLKDQILSSLFKIRVFKFRNCAVSP